METIGIIANLDKDLDAVYSAQLVSWLNRQGVKPFITKQLSQRLPAGVEFYEGESPELFSNSRFIIVLGGDGTILRAARTASLYNAPIIGINLGTLGYLTDVERSGGFEALGKVITGDYKTEKRMMIEAEISGEGYHEKNERLIALNDICILRGAVSKVITLDLSINGLYMDTYRSDGVIVSTPTGSTAYNLSAGGPILKPDIELIAITPVCPHTMYSRPSVVSAGDEVFLEIGDCHGGEPILSLDGQEYVNLKKGQRVRIYKSKAYTTLIKTNNLSFYDILRMKFH